MAERRGGGPLLDTRQLVEACDLFAPLPFAARDRLAEALAPRRYARDEAVYRRGDEAVAFYGVAEGRVRFSALSPDGREAVLSYAGAGQWFGEIGLFDDGPRVVDATADEPARLLVLARRDLLDLCRREPDMMLRVVALFSRRIRTAEEIIVDAAFLALPARLARRLLALAADPSRCEGSGEAVAVRISQDELGRLAGVTRESVGKQLKQWEKDGIVAVEYGRVRLVEPARLRRILAAAIGE